MSQEGATFPQDAAPRARAREGKGREGKGMEVKGSEGKIPPQDVGVDSKISGVAGATGHGSRRHVPVATDGNGHDTAWEATNWPTVMAVWSEPRRYGFKRLTRLDWIDALRGREKAARRYAPARFLAAVLDVIAGEKRPASAEQAMRFIFGPLKAGKAPSDGHYDRAKRLLRKGQP